MKAKNPFDSKLTTWEHKIPKSMLDGAIEVTDMLDIAWASVRAVFEEAAAPEHAVMLVSLILERGDEKRRQLEADIRARTGDAPRPPRVRAAKDPAK